MKKILVISNNESLVILFREYLCLLELKTLEIVNENPPIAYYNTDDAVNKILSSDFDVLVIGHQIAPFYFEVRSGVWKEKREETALNVLAIENIHSFLEGKIVISDGYTPWNSDEIMSSYKKLGVRHFINRIPFDFPDRFNNLILCLSDKCDCNNL